MTSNYETQINELKEIIAKIENGEAGLDESLELYEKGKTILRNCEKILQEAELKVTELSD